MILHRDWAFGHRQKELREAVIHSSVDFFIIRFRKRYAAARGHRALFQFALVDIHGRLPAAPARTDHDDEEHQFTEKVLERGRAFMRDWIEHSKR